MIKSPVIREPVIPSVIFTSPEIGSAGKSEEQCRQENIKVKVSVFPFTANGKAKIQGETEGFVKLIMEEQSRRIIGGVAAGPDASALAGCLAVAITNNLTDDGLSKTVFAHPTTSEAVWEAARAFPQAAYIIMNRIVVSNETDPCYNLALEEELLEQADSGSTLLYLWVNRPCVVLGRNQNPYLECDMDYIKSKGIDLVRRRSGGGAVYQDLGNLNYTFINREGEGSQAMQQQVLLGMMQSAMCGRGIFRKE